MTWNYDPNPPSKTAVRVGGIFAGIHGLLAIIAFSSSGESTPGWIILVLAAPEYYLLNALGLSPILSGMLVPIALSFLVTGGIGALLGLLFRAARRR